MMGYWWDKGTTIGGAPTPPKLTRAAVDITIPLKGVMGTLKQVNANASYYYDNKRTQGKLGFYQCVASSGRYKLVLMFPCVIVDGKVVLSPVYGTATPMSCRYEDSTEDTTKAVGDSDTLDTEPDTPIETAKNIMTKFNSRYMSLVKKVEAEATPKKARAQSIKPIIGPTSSGVWCYSHSAGSMAYSVETGIQPVLNAQEPAHIITQVDEPGIYFANAEYAGGGINIGCTQKPASSWGSRYATAHLFHYSYLEVT